jgi:hypothetical protein
MILSTWFEGESQELGNAFAAIAVEVARANRPVRPPALLIGGGETIVRLNGRAAGAGGPNQEFAIAAAIALDGIQDLVIAGLDSDGTDGPTDIAGAMVDGGTVDPARARHRFAPTSQDPRHERGIEPHGRRDHHRSDWDQRQRPQVCNRGGRSMIVTPSSAASFALGSPKA